MSAEYCHKCGRVHADRGIAGCPEAVPYPVAVYRQTGQQTIDIDWMRAEIATLRSELVEAQARIKALQGYLLYDEVVERRNNERGSQVPDRTANSE